MCFCKYENMSRKSICVSDEREVKRGKEQPDALLANCYREEPRGPPGLTSSSYIESLSTVYRPP